MRASRSVVRDRDHFFSAQMASEKRQAGSMTAPEQGFFTAGNRSGYHGNCCYRRGTVTVLSGSNRYEFSNLNFNSKNEKNNKNLQKIVHDL
jgi:hypothetical protein